MDINKVREIRKRIEDEKVEDRKRLSGERLSRSLDRKFRTTFIGSLSAFENEFAHLWGFNKPEEDLTDEEYDWRLRWIDTRNRILNNGNAQRRAAQAELEEYTVDWNRHNINFTIRENGK